MPLKGDDIFSSLRAIFAGWLVIALLLPAGLGLVPKAQANSTEELLQISELQLCAQLGHLDGQDHGKTPGSQRMHDCPCCLPTFAGLAALPPQDPLLLPAQVWHGEKLALVEFALRRLVGQPHHLAPARAPPTLLSI